MSTHEKVCKDCKKTFQGFTPICKECNAKKGELKGPVPPVVSTAAPSTTTATAPRSSSPTAAPAPTSSSYHNSAPSRPAPTTSSSSSSNPFSQHGSNHNNSNHSSMPSAFSMNRNNRGGGGSGGSSRGGGYSGGSSSGGGGRGGGGGDRGNGNNSTFTDREASLFRKNNRRGGGTGAGEGGGRGSGEGGRGGGAGGNNARGRRKTQLCEHYPNCKYSDEDCKYIHPAQASNAFQHLQKVCKQFKENGTCKYGTRCHFIHDAANIPKRDTTKDSKKTTDAIPIFGSSTQAPRREDGPSHHAPSNESSAPTGPKKSQTETTWRTGE